MNFSFNFLELFLLFLSSQTLAEFVTIDNGQIVGNIRRSRGGRSYSEYLGIPYAKPPIGDLRWRDPQPIENWKGTLSTRAFKSECTQIEILITGRLQGSEDCLYLNVFTPNREDNELLPVMVFVHGGLFMGGGSNLYRGKYFMDEDIVLVTMNYRLGILGFLSTGDEEVRGNLGLKDQNLVLKWVQRNVENFGGDPNRVTLFGESAGGAAVHYHLFSPMSKGLFHRAISQSGSAIRTYTSTRDQRGQAEALGRRFGCTSPKSKELIDCLRKIDARRMVQIDHKALAENNGEYALYAPIPEPINDDKAFLPIPPRDLVDSGNYNKVPWMVGVNDAEGLLYVGKILADKSLLNRIDGDWEFLAPYLLNYPPERKDAAQKIRDFYFSGGSVTKNLDTFTAMFTDLLFALPLREAAKSMSKHTPTYLYYYSHKARVSVFDLIRAVRVGNRIPAELQIAASFVTRFFAGELRRNSSTHMGAAHGDELSLMFNTHPFNVITRLSRDYSMSRELVKTWASYARNESQIEFDGNPINQLQVQNGVPKYFDMKLPSRGTIDEPFTSRMKFWQDLDLDYINNNFFIIYFQGHKWITK